jgi:hypothetical protein
VGKGMKGVCMIKTIGLIFILLLFFMFYKWIHKIGKYREEGGVHGWDEDVE